MSETKLPNAIISSSLIFSLYLLIFESISLIILLLGWFASITSANRLLNPNLNISSVEITGFISHNKLTSSFVLIASEYLNLVFISLNFLDSVKNHIFKSANFLAPLFLLLLT